MISRTPKRAFTLIELLVVIAIIAILAAILFPVFARAREQARKTSCLSNEKQLGTAFHMYAQDYDECFPAVPFNGAGCQGGGCYPWNFWPGSIDWNGVFTHGVQPYIKNTQVFKCPSSSDTERWSGRNGVHYGYSEYLYDGNRGWNKMATLASSTVGVASVSIITETWASGIYNDWSDDAPPPAWGNDGMSRVRYAQYNPWKANHDGCNVVYADGHTKFVPKDGVANRNGKQRPIVNPQAGEL